MRKVILLACFEPLQPNAFSFLVPGLERVFQGLPLEFIWYLEPLHCPRAWWSRREQWSAEQLLTCLARKRRTLPGGHALVGLHPGDLTLPRFNFVFGLADPPRKVAVVGLRRLQDRKPERWMHRVTTELVHEVGHLFRMHHCPDSRCVMAFSRTLEETDRKGPSFCAACQELIQTRVTPVSQR